MIDLVTCERRNRDLNSYGKEEKDMERRFGENLQIAKDIEKWRIEERGTLSERYQEIDFCEKVS